MYWETVMFAVESSAGDGEAVELVAWEAQRGSPWTQFVLMPWMTMSGLTLAAGRGRDAVDDRGTRGYVDRVRQLSTWVSVLTVRLR